jgi:ribonuclease Z
VIQGKSLGWVSDTGVCGSLDEIARGVDLLICESTFLSDLGDKAEGYYHMTSEQAGLLASRSGAKKLIITHFSQRYPSSEPLENEAKKYFPNTAAAFDFLKVKLN